MENGSFSYIVHREQTISDRTLRDALKRDRGSKIEK